MASKSKALPGKVYSQIDGACCRIVQLHVVSLSAVILKGEFLNEDISQRHDTHITNNDFFDLRVERLCFTATDLERLKADLFTAREIETMILDLVAVATDDKGTIPFFVAGQIGMGFELLGILPIEDVRGLLLSICCESRACARDFS